MTAAATLDDVPAATEAEWWYRTAGGTSGPVTAAELRRLSLGPLGGDALVWRKGFGDRWRRLTEAVAPVEQSGPPPLDCGRWTKAFAAVEADPNGSHLSVTGLLGPVGYLFLGMWRRFLVLFAAMELARVPCLIVDGVYGTPLRFLPPVVAIAFCVWRVKPDYYRHRILGETMWPRLRFMRSAWICLPAAAVSMFLALLVARAVTLSIPPAPIASSAATASSTRIASTVPTSTSAAPDPSDPITSDIAGLWQGEAGNVLLDVAGGAKRIVYGGRTRVVRVAKVDDDGEGVVFEVLRGDGGRISVRKRWSEDRTTWSLDLYDGDLLIANLAFLKPV